MMTAMSYRGKGLIPLILASIFGLLGLAVLAITPPGKFPDELSHLHYIRYVRAHHELPPVGFTFAEMPIGQGFQPPLYYVAAAFLVPDHPETGIFAFRFFSLFLGVLTLLIVWRTALLVFRTDLPATLLSCAFVAFTPRFLYISAGVGNLSMTAATCALTLHMLARMLMIYGSLPRQCLIMGLTAGLAMLSRTTAAYLIPVCIVGILYRLRKENRFAWRSVLKNVLAFSAGAFMVAGWWYLRNWILYEDPVLWKVVRATSGSLWIRTEAPTLFYLFKQTAFLHASYWVYFGEAEFHAGIWEYAVYLFLMVVAFVGLMEIRFRKAEPAVTNVFAGATLWFFVSSSALAVLQILLVQIRMDAPEGRYLYIAISPISMSLAAGWVRAIPQRLRMRGAAALSAFLCVFCVYLLLSYWLPHFV